MSLKVLDEDISKKELKNVYFFFGDDLYELERYVEKIKKVYDNLELGVNFFALDKSNIDSLLDICTSVSFFGEEKLVLVKDTKLKFNVDLLNELKSTKSTVVIIEPEVDKRTSEYKKMQKLAVCVEFAVLKAKDATQYVRKVLAGYKVNVSEEVAMYMVEVCTPNKQLLINEFRKIVAYLKPGDMLTKEIIDKICVRTLDAKIFDVIDNIIAKKKDVAFSELDDLIAQKTYIGVISSVIYKQLKQLYMIKLLEEKMDKTKIRIDIPTELGINPFVYSKLGKIKGMYTKEKLEELLLEFAEYDENSKTGLDDAELGLKRIVAML